MLIHDHFSVISGLCRGVNEIFDLLGCYSALTELPTFRDNLSVLPSRVIWYRQVVPKRPYYQSTLRITPEDRRYLLRSLTSKWCHQ